MPSPSFTAMTEFTFEALHFSHPLCGLFGLTPAVLCHQYYHLTVISQSSTSHTHVLLPQYAVQLWGLLHCGHYPWYSLVSSALNKSSPLQAVPPKLFFYLAFCVNNCFLLTVIGYDCYVAICNTQQFSLTVCMYTFGQVDSRALAWAQLSFKCFLRSSHPSAIPEVCLPYHKGMYHFAHQPVFLFCPWTWSSLPMTWLSPPSSRWYHLRAEKVLCQLCFRPHNGYYNCSSFTYLNPNPKIPFRTDLSLWGTLPS
jgi:hypothetical protein